MNPILLRRTFLLVLSLCLAVFCLLTLQTSVLGRPPIAHHEMGLYRPLLYAGNEELGGKASRPAGNTKYIIYECKGSCGGLGDRLKGMVNAYLWALVTNRTMKFILEHPCPDFLEGLLVPNLTKWDKDIPSTKDAIILDLIDDEKFRKILLRGNLEKLYASDVIILRTNINYWVEFTKVTHYRGILQRHGFSDFSLRGIFKKAFQDMFTWSPNLKATFTRLKNRTSPLVCVQVRVGGSSKSMAFDPPRRNMASVLKQFKTFAKVKNVAPKSKVFVTTDSVEVTKLAQKLFGSSYLETPGEITHSDRSKAGEACAGMKKVILDFYILTECDYLQVSRSGYGILASYLNRNQKNVSMIWKGGIVHGVIPERFLNYGGAPDF